MAWLLWLEGHPGLAGWIQGVGSLIGLAIAIWVPKNIAQKAEKRQLVEARYKAMGMGLAVRYELRRIKFPLDAILAQWPEGSDMPELIGQRDGGRSEIFEYFNFPPELAGLYGGLHELEYAAYDSIMAIARAEEVKQTLNTIEIGRDVYDLENSAELEHRLRSLIQECLVHVDAAIAKVGLLLDESRH
ncbi:hypothetical protein [Rhodanobacter koreensis]